MISWISSYYNNEFLLKHFWLPTAYAMRDHVEAIIVDDHSQESPAKQVFEESKLDMPLKIYYVNEDLGFNSHGARNLGVAKAKNDVILLTDMDKTIGTVGMYHIITQGCKRGEYYRLLNWGDSGNKQIIKPSANNFILNKHDFMEIKGYTEELTGTRQGDYIFRKVLSTIATEKTDEKLRCICLEKENAFYLRVNDRSKTSLVMEKEMRRARLKNFSDKPFINYNYTRIL